MMEGDCRRQGGVMVQCLAITSLQFRQEVEEIAYLRMGPGLRYLSVMTEAFDLLLDLQQSVF